eukprot:g4900.t1
MLRALARGPRGLDDLQVEREILSKALLTEFFEKFSTDSVFDHDSYYHLSLSYMMPLFQQDAETVVAAMRRCVTDRFEDQLLHFVRLRLRASGASQNGGDLFSETQVKSLAGKMFTRLFSVAFEGARGPLVDIYRDTAQDDDLFDLDEDSVAYLEQLSDTDDKRDILEASRQHVRQARIAALPTANRKSKHAFLLAPLFKAKPVFLRITQSVLCILFRFLDKEMDDVENLLDTMWWWKLIMVVDGMTIGGGRFQCVKSRRRFRNRLRRLHCVATDVATWESALRSQNPNMRCPWLISGFSSNGYELNIHVKTVRRGKDRSGEGAEDTSLIDRLPGHAETYKRAYSYCPCLNWDGASPLPAGIYKDLKRQVEDGHGAHLFADQLILCIDPGKVNILSWILFRVCTDLSIVPVDYGFVEGTAYQRHMPQLGQYELWRRTMNEEYSTAIEEMKTYTKKTVHLETFEDYMHASIRFYPVFAQENAMQERCARLFIGKIQRRQQMDKLARLICNRCDPHLILFGRSSVRHFAFAFAAFVINPSIVGCRGDKIAVLANHGESDWAPGSACARDNALCNIRLYEVAISAAARNGASLVLFPEGYGVENPSPPFETLVASVSETPCGNAQAPQQALLSCAAKRFNVSVVANLFLSLKNGTNVIMDIVFANDGSVSSTYAKNHLFLTEKKVFSPGPFDPTVFTHHGASFALLICYEGVYPYIFRDFSQLEAFRSKGAQAVLWSVGGASIEVFDMGEISGETKKMSIE